MLTPSRPLAEAEQKGVEAATALGLNGKTATAAQLRSVSAQTLVANAATQRGFSPPIDGKFKTTSTIDALNGGTEIDVPVLIGSNSGEGGFDGGPHCGQTLRRQQAPARGSTTSPTSLLSGKLNGRRARSIPPN